MLGYDCEIIYKKGNKNVVANALSRKAKDVEALLYAISIIELALVENERLVNQKMTKIRISMTNFGLAIIDG